MMMPIRSLLAMTLAVMAAGLSGCNTVEGFGKDMRSAGDAIAGSADDEQDDDEQEVDE